MSLMKLSLLSLSLEDIVVNEHPWSLMMSKFKMKQLSLMQPHTLYIQQRVCHTPIPGQTRLADPNRVRGARPYTGTLYLFFFFLTESKYHIHMERTTTRVVSINIYIHILSPIYLYIYKNNFTFQLHIQSAEPTLMNPY